MVEKLSPIAALLPTLRASTTGERPATPDGPMSLVNLLGAQRSGSTSTSSSIISGEVQRSMPANPEQRAQLVDRLLEAMAQWRNRPASPQRDQQLAQLAAEQRLLNSPLLQLVRVRLAAQHGSPSPSEQRAAADTRTAPPPTPASLLLYTDRPLKVGQRLPLYIHDGQLRQSPPSVTQSMREQALTHTTDALRRSLPQRDGNGLSAALSQLDTLSLPQQRELFGSRLQEALRSAAQQLRQPAQLTQPGALRQALLENGTQLEARLLRALRAASAERPGALLTAAQKLAQTHAPGNTRADSVANVLANDWKAALLKVLTRSQAELSRLGSSADLSRSALPDLGTLLAALIGSARSNSGAEQQTLRTQLLQQVQQLTLQSLARVQVQQQQSLAQFWSAGEPGQTAAQPWVLELPMRWGQDVQTLSLRIAEDPEPEDSAEEGSHVRQWQVQLGFDLPGIGPFHALVTVRDEQVATRFWIERPEMAETIRHRLGELQHKLEKEGITVTRLECHVGKPPTSGSRVQYSLVDIRT